MARAPLPPCTLSTITLIPRTRERYAHIPRRKTSLPPPGLKCVVSITTLFGYLLCALAIAPPASARVSNIATPRRVVPISAEFTATAGPLTRHPPYVRRPTEVGRVP